MKSPRRVSLCIAAFVAVADQLTKWWVLSTMRPGRPRHLFWTLQINLTHNSGMAFSQGRGLGPVIGVLAMFVIIAIVLSLHRTPSRVAVVSAGLVVGGAVGNIIDRLFRSGGFLRGEVIDYIDFKWWPVFNVADMAISIGGVLLVLTSRKVPAGA